MCECPATQLFQEQAKLTRPALRGMQLVLLHGPDPSLGYGTRRTRNGKKRYKPAEILSLLRKAEVLHG